MDKIPVTFTLNNIEYKGTLEEVFGAGGNTWHLMVNRCYWGTLKLYGDNWVFNEQRPCVAHLVEYFAGVVIAAYG